MMTLRLVLMLTFLLITGHVAYAQDEPLVELELSGNKYVTSVPVYLTKDDKRWLRQIKTLRVAVYQSEVPPLAQTTITGRYRGMNADYLALIQHSLNIRLRVMAYKNQAVALEALKAGEFDMMLTGLGSTPLSEEGINASLPLVHSWPNLVTSLTNVMSPLQSAQSTRIAIVNNYSGADFIRQTFLNAEIANYSNYQEALSSVANGKEQWFIGDSLTTSTWLSQEFSLALTTVKYWQEPQKRVSFYFCPARNAC